MAQMQIAADVFGLAAERPAVAEASALGAAMLAAAGLGWHADVRAAAKAMARPAGDSSQGCGRGAHLRRALSRGLQAALQAARAALPADSRDHRVSGLRADAQMRRSRPAQYGSRSRRLKILPVSSRGSSSWKSTTRGTLKPARRSRRNAARRPRRGRPGSRLHRCCQRLAELRIGNAEHGAVGDAGHGDQHRLDLGRIDVDAAGDHHVVLAVDDVEIAVGVEIAHVAQRPEAVALELAPRGVVVGVGEVGNRRDRGRRAGRPCTRRTSCPSTESTFSSTPCIARPAEPGRAGPRGCRCA